MAIPFLNATVNARLQVQMKAMKLYFQNSTVEDYGRFQTQQKQYSKKLKNISKLLLPLFHSNRELSPNEE